MKLTLENIGKVKHAEIDLSKDLIVLCGPNNTGKTYIAYSVFGIFRNRQFLIDFVSHLPLIGEEIEITLEQFVLVYKTKIITEIKKEFLAFLQVLFASSYDSFEDPMINIELGDDEILSAIGTIEERIAVANSFSKGMKIHTRKDNGVWKIVFVGIDQSNEIKRLSLAPNAIGSFITAIIFRNVVLAPAERIAINIFSKELSERRMKLVDELLDASGLENPLEIVKEKATRFSVPIRENLATAERMDVYQKTRGSFAHLGEEIEAKILQGTLRVSEYGEVRFKPNDSEKDMGIHMAGSVVKSLASIVFYLKHIAEPNDFYIIDEPELTLHPDNQRKIARILARMVNAGIKVMMSTHSDYIIRELNNLMMLKVDGQEETVKKLMEDYGYKQEELLDFNRVGAYMFTDKISPLEVNETGFEVSTIDDEIHSLNNSSAEIYFKLHD